MDRELAALAGLLDRLVQEKIGAHLEDLVAQRHREGGNVLGDFVAWLQRLAEVVIDDAVKVRDGLLPVLLKEDKGLVRDAEVAAAGVDDGREAAGAQQELLGAVLDASGLDGPLLHALGPFGPVGERLHLVQAPDTADDLVRIEATEDSEGARFARTSRAEADHGVINETVSLKLADVIEVTVVLVWVDGQAEHAIDVVESDGLEQSEEVERCARRLVLVETGLIVYQLSGKLGRAVIEVLRLLQHLVGRTALGGEGGRLALAQVLAGRRERQCR